MCHVHMRISEIKLPKLLYMFNDFPKYKNVACLFTGMNYTKGYHHPKRRCFFKKSKRNGFVIENKARKYAMGHEKKRA